ncbi:MAG: tRNA (adenosine(37)-N6)-threonylcarbamoyltransferase complex dimerization subunit type 1 TsaB [Rhizobiaceae bacterium]|nr:tRNA (adenosine(37)-N6)-threonylcarbamoyltransferase complex dimerization subunit type 1 TsaB [Rhizobiaceae bacterium]
MLLAIDTCASLCAASVSDDGAELGRCVRDIGTGHAEQLMDVIAEALSAAGRAYRDITGIAVAVGPGSFTGIRVGVSTARGLALALKVPSTGVGTLDAIAGETQALFPGRSLVVAIDARREEVYTAAWDADGALVAPPAVTGLDDAVALTASLVDPVLAGSAAPALIAAAGGAHDVASTLATADIAAYARLAARRGFSGERPKPLYLRPPDAKPQASFVLPRREDGQ